MSSNYVFRRLVADNYLNCPDEFIDKFYEYHLHDAYTFDLSEKGGTLPELPVPDAKMIDLPPNSSRIFVNFSSMMS